MVGFYPPFLNNKYAVLYQNVLIMQGIGKAKSLKEDKEITKFINQLKKITVGIETINFAKEFASLITTLKKSEEAYYILDIHNMCYIFLNDSFSFITGYDNELLIKDKWIYPKELVLQEDKLRLCVTLKQGYKLINELPREERTQAWITTTYRMECGNKQIIKVLQKARIIAVDSNGAPALELGRITDLTDFKQDNKVSGRFEINNTKQLIKPSELLPKLNKYTAKQLEHAQYVAEGKSTYEITQLTGKSENNVEKHLERFRLNSKSGTLKQAIAKAKDEGVIK